jgi:hypothetical protein
MGWLLLCWQQHQQWHLLHICCLLHLQLVHELLRPMAPQLQTLDVFPAAAAAAAAGCNLQCLLPRQLLSLPNWHQQQCNRQQQHQGQHLHCCCQLQQQHAQPPAHVLLLPKAPLLQTLEAS